ncbi:N-alpha-acetyltransferase 40 [Apiospora rasikravindrae]|uniref:N-alpha-acetyltransferase 40 n=1 Tax=Apiospora rasikravindrae TaxID=990691 RepID=A0ABR1RPW0_9PEZI
MATTNRRQKRKRGEPTPIELVNRKDDAQFIADHLHPRRKRPTPSAWSERPRLSEADLEVCLALVEETSRADYEPSSMGWKPAQKRAEMKSPELRYILVRDVMGAIRGFTSLMPTYEEGQPVVYCYEIHLKPDLQGGPLAFYRKRGFEKDEMSPEPRKLRFGKVFVPDYMIMSKGVVNEVDVDANVAS